MTPVPTRRTQNSTEFLKEIDRLIDFWTGGHRKMKYGGRVGDPSMSYGSTWPPVCDMQQKLATNVWRPECPSSNARRRRADLPFHTLVAIFWFTFCSTASSESWKDVVKTDNDRIWIRDREIHLPPCSSLECFISALLFRQLHHHVRRLLLNSTACVRIAEPGIFEVSPIAVPWHPSHAGILVDVSNSIKTLVSHSVS